MLTVTTATATQIIIRTKTWEKLSEVTTAVDAGVLAEVGTGAFEEDAATLLVAIAEEEGAALLV
jgi:hypothetical protein